MARFSDLSAEVVDLILSHLHPPPLRHTSTEADLAAQHAASAPAFRALALTSRALAGPATAHLYATLSLRLAYPRGGGGGGDGDGDGDAFALLCRTLREAPPARAAQLRSHVRAAALWAYWNQGALTADAVALLNGLPRVRDLQLRTFGGLVYGDAHARALGCVRARALPRLASLYLNCRAWVGDVVRLVVLTRVEAVRVTSVGMGRPGGRGVVRDVPGRKEVLRDLRIDEEVEWDGLGVLLRSIGGCRRLGLGGSWAVKSEDGVPEQTASRRRIREALEPARDVLELLHLRCMSWILEDTTALDLHGFSVLKVLSVDSRCFFSQGQGKRDISSWLPPWLEYLEVVFNYTDAVAIFADYWPREDDHQWLVDIARNKHTSYPQLRRLHVRDLWEQQEKNLTIGALRYWHVPVDVEAEFSMAEIELRVVIRAIGQEPCQTPKCIVLPDKDLNDENLDEDTWAEYFA